MDPRDILDRFSDKIKEGLRKAVLDTKPRCRAKCAGIRCKNNATCSGHRLCKRHKDYVIRDLQTMMYHNHIPGETRNDCAACLKFAGNVYP